MTDTELAASVVEATIDGVIKQYVDGTWAIRVKIDPPQVKAFLDGFRDIGTRVAIARLGDPETPPAVAEKQVKRELAAPGTLSRAIHDGQAARPWGKHAQALRLHIDWMGNPKVWLAFGGDDDYLKWVREGVCCASDVNCSGDVVAAHVRRIESGAGIGIKPKFSAVPLCSTHHSLQHQNGENGFGDSKLSGKEWFDKQRIDHLHDWLWHAMKLHFGVDSMSRLDPFELLDYAVAAGVDQHLPECYRGG